MGSGDSNTIIIYQPEEEDLNNFQIQNDAERELMILTENLFIIIFGAIVLGFLFVFIILSIIFGINVS